MDFIWFILPAFMAGALVSVALCIITTLRDMWE